MELSVRLKKTMQSAESVTLSNVPPVIPGATATGKHATEKHAPEKHGPAEKRDTRTAAEVRATPTPLTVIEPDVTITVSGPAVAGSGMWGTSVDDGLEFQVTVSART